MVDIVGRWNIVSWEQLYDDGRRLLPMGETLTGFIQYDADGHMAVMIMKSDRPRFTTGGLWDASDEEKAGAYRSMLAYAGTYERVSDAEGESVLHHVDLSLYPNWTGGVQRRRLVSRDDGRIVLEARFEEGTPEARTAALVWQRAEGSRS